MRAFWVIAIMLAACGDDSEGDPKDFVDQGGQREIDDCGYTLMTRAAEGALQIFQAILQKDLGYRDVQERYRKLKAAAAS